MKARNKFLSGLVALALAATIAPVGAADAERIAEVQYRAPGEIEAGPAVILVGPIWVNDQQTIGGVRFKPMRGERFVSFSIVDDSGQPIQGHVEQHFGSDDEFLGHFCGETTRPWRIYRDADLVVYPGSATCDGGTNGATQGTVIARFTK